LLVNLFHFTYCSLHPWSAFRLLEQVSLTLPKSFHFYSVTMTLRSQWSLMNINIKLTCHSICGVMFWLSLFIIIATITTTWPWGHHENCSFYPEQSAIILSSFLSHFLWFKGMHTISKFCFVIIHPTNTHIQLHSLETTQKRRFRNKLNSLFPFPNSFVKWSKNVEKDLWKLNLFIVYFNNRILANFKTINNDL